MCTHVHTHAQNSTFIVSFLNLEPTDKNPIYKLEKKLIMDPGWANRTARTPATPFLLLSRSLCGHSGEEPWHDHTHWA